MTEAERIMALRERHCVLDRQLEEEEARPLPDSTVLHDIKRQKLARKDELTRPTGVN